MKNLSFSLILFLILLILLNPCALHSQGPINLRNIDSMSENGQMDIQTVNYEPGEKVLARDGWPNYWDDYDPGIAPEGDYLAGAVFSPDGSKIYLTNRFTDMLTVFEWSTMEVLANITTGDYPSCVAATEDLIIVGCQFSDHVYVFDASDYLLVDSIPTGEQPCRVHVSPEENYAFAACDIDDVCTVIDLNSLTVMNTINDFPVYLQTISWSTQSARNWAKYSDFLVSPGGDYLITHNGQNQVQAFNVTTGAIDYSGDVESPRAVAFAGDSNSVVCASNPFNVANVHSFAWPGLDLETSVEISGYRLATNEIVADSDGSRAYIGTGDNTSTLVRLYNGDFITFSNTYTAFWLGVTHDHQYAIGGQYRFSVIDFENEVMTDQFQGKNQSWGTVSPVGYHIFGYDPLLYEGAHFFDISDPDDIDFRGSVLSGEDPEGDAPYRVAFHPFFEYAVSVNNLSQSCSILEFGTWDVIASIDLGEACYDVVTKGEYAVCGGYNNNTVKIIDLSYGSLELVAEVPTGQRPMELTAHPFEDIVYAANIKSNSISVIEVNGAGSQVIATIPCGVIGVYIPFFGIRSGVEVAPSGDYLLVAASFDDQVKIIDTETNHVVKSLDVGDFPLAIAFNDYGTIACVTNLFDHTFSLISVDGADSEVIGTWPANGDYPVDADYNRYDEEFWLCNYNSGNITKFDATSGAYNGQVNMNAYGGVWMMDFYENADPIYLTVGNDDYGPSVIFQDSIFELPASASHMVWDYIWMGAYAAVSIPGPDYVSIIELDWLEQVGENSEIKDHIVSLYPNPFTEQLQVSSKKEIRSYRIFDLSGRLMVKGNPNSRDFKISRGALESGQYLLEVLFYDAKRASRKIVLID